MTVPSLPSPPISGGVQFCGRQIQSIEDGLTLLEGAPAPEQYGLQLELLSILLRCRAHNAEAISRLCDYAISSEAWKYDRSLHAFQSDWKEASKTVKEHKDNERRIRQVKDKATTLWGSDNTNIFFIRVVTRTMADRVSKLLTQGIEYDRVQLAVNNEIVARLRRSGPGQRRFKGVMQGDIAKAFEKKCFLDLQSQDLEELGLQLGDDGFLCPIGKGGNLLPQASCDTVDRLPDSRAATGDDATQGETMDSDDELSVHHSSGVGSIDGSSTDLASDTDCASSINSASTDSASDTDFHTGPTLPQRSSRPTCGCRLSIGLIQQIRKREYISENKVTQLLRKVGWKLKKFSSSNICWKHTRNLCFQLGMRHWGASHHELARRLTHVYTNMGNFDAVRTEKHEWFHHTRRPEVPEDSLGCYRFQHQALQPLVATPGTFDMKIGSVYYRCFGKALSPDLQHLETAMSEDGSIVVPGLYSWLSDNLDDKHPGGILALAHTEFDMYEYHYAERPGTPRIGWLRNMWFSLIQQLLRQDPAYYMFYVALRPDHVWRLISCPYYCKSTLPGEKTAFRHIDINIPDLLATGRGKNILQGSVSLTDEGDRDCTELLLGMHRHLGDWWKDVESRRPQEVRSYIMKIHPEMWTDEDEEKYQITWKKQICSTGDARFSLPDIPHGSLGPATIQRRTVLPWFVGIKDDHEQLDTAESGTWSELSVAHRDHLPTKRTVSGFQSAHLGRIPYAFPAVVSLHGLGAISDALVGRRRWFQAEVVQELDVLFGSSADKAASFIRTWRRKAFCQLVSAFERMERAERTAFGKDSFFLRREQGLLPAMIHLTRYSDVEDTVMSDCEEG